MEFIDKLLVFTLRPRLTSILWQPLRPAFTIMLTFQRPRGGVECPDGIRVVVDRIPLKGLSRIGIQPIR